MKQAKTTKQPLEVDGIVHFNSLKVGDQFRFTSDGENVVRTISQIGKTEIYCPIDGSNTMGHSKAGGEEVYMKSDKPVIKLKPFVDSKEGLHTQGEWYVSSVLHKDKNMCPVPYHEISVRDGDKSSWWLATVNASENAFSLEESKANAELIVKAVNEYEILKEARNVLCQLVKDKENERKALLDALELYKSYTAYCDETISMNLIPSPFQVWKNVMEEDAKKQY